jgi:hypothetical protein
MLAVIEMWNHEWFQVAIGPVLPICPQMMTFSEGTYENKSFCVAYCNASAKNDNDCHMLSIGSNDQWSFEE